MFVCEATLPFNKVVGRGLTGIELAVTGTDDALDGSALLEIFLDALFLELVRLDFFRRDITCITSGLKRGVTSPDVFDVVVDALEAFVAFKELVAFLGVVEVGEAFPLDVEALRECERERVSVLMNIPCSKWVCPPGHPLLVDQHMFRQKIRAHTHIIVARMTQDHFDFVLVLKVFLGGRLSTRVAALGVRVHEPIRIVLVAIVGSTGSGGATRHGS